MGVGVGVTVGVGVAVGVGVGVGVGVAGLGLALVSAWLRRSATRSTRCLSQVGHREVLLAIAIEITHRH